MAMRKRRNIRTAWTIFCLIDPTTSGALEESPEGFGFKGCGLLTECVQQIDDGEAVGIERGLRGPSMRTHPLSKCPGGRARVMGAPRRLEHQPQGCKEGDKMAGTQNHGPIAPARIT